MLSLTHPTIDLYLCLTHAQLSSRCVCVALFAPTDITFSEWADESCIIIIIAVEERTCALPGIVFNSKPRLIFNPCIIVDGALQRSNVYVVDGVVRSLSIFRFFEQRILTPIWLIVVYISHIIHTHRPSLCVYGLTLIVLDVCTAVFWATVSNRKPIQQKTFLLYAVVCSLVAINRSRSGARDHFANIIHKSNALSVCVWCLPFCNSNFYSVFNHRKSPNKAGYRRCQRCWKWILVRGTNAVESSIKFVFNSIRAVTPSA